MRALIVDDSPVIRILLQRVLGGYGECEVAKDGQEGFDTYSRSLGEGVPFDLVCLDLGLPLISGPEVLCRIRALEAESTPPVQARILVITASSEHDMVDTVRRQGADGYLVKPVDRKKLAGYLRLFGFTNLQAGAAPAGDPIQALEELCDQDMIPPPVLARLIERMAGSMGRQLSRHSLRPATQAARSTTA
ncbi:MAG: response regulator [Candidatus Solibacter sp.]